MPLRVIQCGSMFVSVKQTMQCENSLESYTDQYFHVVSFVLDSSKGFVLHFGAHVLLND